MTARPSRPMLRPAVPVLWRGADSVQIGEDPAGAVILTGLPPQGRELLDLLDGHRTEPDITAAAAHLGMAATEVREILGGLRGCGALVDGDPVADLPPRLPTAARHRLTTEFGTGAGAVRPDLPHEDPRPGARVAARGRARVVVRGGGRIGVPLAAILATAGVGHVHVDVGGTVLHAEVTPGGHRADDVHRPRATAAAEAVQAVAPEADTRPLPAGAAPDFVVLVGSRRPAVVDASTPQTRRAAHLVVSVRGDRAVVGPLVLPGRTACLRCVDLHRCDRDPTWPALAAQLATAPGRQHCSAAMAALAAAAGALQVLAHLDGGTPETVSASLEIGGPAGLLRRRTWAPHPRCDCTEGRLADVG
jgi:hypothetical protein